MLSGRWSRRSREVLVGNEDRGLSNDALDQCDEIVFIPQFGKVGSLNVATAASIGMYEWARQQLEAAAHGSPDHLDPKGPSIGPV